MPAKKKVAEPKAAETPVEQPQEAPVIHLPAEVKKSTTKKAASPYQEPPLQRGEALIYYADENGNEVGEPFVTNIQSAEKYYSGPGFIIKKK